MGKPIKKAGSPYYWVIFALFCVALIATLWLERHYLILSFAVMVLAAIPFYIRFETRSMKAEEIVFMASLTSLAAMGRIPFAALPGVQPSSFIIIMSGIMLGPESGFMIGSTTALTSNLFLGQGPWTPWQMMAWGLMGFSAGLLRNKGWVKQRLGLSLFGFLWGFLFGWIMNLWFLLGFFQPFTWQIWGSAFAASFYFDLAHALTNGVFLWYFSRHWRRILERTIRKYGLLM